jgi:hypothetical protein
MNLIEIQYTPKAEIKFTRAELNIMLKCSKRHYDMVCQQASADVIRSTGKIGLIRGAINYQRSTKGKSGLAYSFYDLDTLVKCLEVAHAVFGLEPKKALEAARLSLRIGDVLGELNASAIHPKVYNKELTCFDSLKK